jgi:predicted phage baseplate assembly protein
LAGDPCQREAPEPLPPRYRPQLAKGPLTQQGTVVKTLLENGIRRSERLLFDADAAASAALHWKTADSVPAISLDDGDKGWSARRELLASGASDTHFVVEIEADGSARLRFGDGVHGRRPDSGADFEARYRIGNGVDGNVGADSIAHALTTEGRITTVRNPLPASGGVAAESAAEVRRRAPYAFRTQERAVTPADYAEVTTRLGGVQRAAACLRWSGSWHTVFTTVDREGGAAVDAAFATTVVEHLERYRMAGHDLRVNDPLQVSLEIDLLVCVNPDYFRSNVRRGLLDALSSRARADGERGLFHPDNFSFGQTVFLSPLYAAARAVPGVDSVQVTRFHRQGQEDPGPLADGFMTLERLEIARLDNDPNFPEHGVLRLDLHGGK